MQSFLYCAQKSVKFANFQTENLLLKKKPTDFVEFFCGNSKREQEMHKTLYILHKIVLFIFTKKFHFFCKRGLQKMNAVL